MVTIVDVAHKAGVTPTTVSYVINGSGSVGTKTRERVQAAIAELGYQPNLVARGLKRGKTMTLAFVLPSIANPFYPEIADEVDRIARLHGYHILLCNTHADRTPGHEQLESLVGRWIDGLIVMASSVEPSDVHAFYDRGVPLVWCLWPEDQAFPDMPLVDVHFAAAGALAAQHLLELGHTQVGIIGELPNHAHRLAGFCDAYTQAGVRVPPSHIFAGDSTMESGYRALVEMLALPMHPTAVYATNDWMAIGAIEAALDQGLRVPEDLAVIGLDDIMLSAHFRPSLTTVAIPKRELAMEAITMLLNLIEKRPTPTWKQVEPHLVVRHSTLPRP